MGATTKSALDPKAEEDRLKTLVSDILDEARRQGADACEVGVSLDAGLSVGVRMGDVETVEFNRDQGFGITVYRGKRKGSASTSDSSTGAIRETVKAAYDIAGYASEDPSAGLADKELMATELPDLDLYHPWGIEADDAIKLALKCEEAGRTFDSRISNSDGANVATHQGCRVYGNSHGFIGSYVSTRHSLSCVLIGQSGDDMQRDYWYTVARDALELESAAQVGQTAARRTVSRLGSRKVATGQVLVLFAPEVATGLVSHFLAAISGGNLYRQASFLLNHLGRQVLPDWVRIHEQPHLKKALGSGSFDNDGLPTRAKDFVTDGVLVSYLLSTYSGRKLGLKSTGNAGGVHNLFLDSNAGGQDELLKAMGSGLLVTELMGQGVNTVTGDYSRGAAGYWVENGVIQYPVSEVTIAGNLRDMFMNIVAAGNDYDRRGNVQAGSVLVEGMTLAGE